MKWMLNQTKEYAQLGSAYVELGSVAEPSNPPRNPNASRSKQQRVLTAAERDALFDSPSPEPDSLSPEPELVASTAPVASCIEYKPKPAACTTQREKFFDSAASSARLNGPAATGPSSRLTTEVTGAPRPMLVRQDSAADIRKCLMEASGSLLERVLKDDRTQIDTARPQQLLVILEHLTQLGGSDTHADAVWGFVTNVVLRATYLDSELISPQNKNGAIIKGFDRQLEVGCCP